MPVIFTENAQTQVELVAFENIIFWNTISCTFNFYINTETKINIYLEQNIYRNSIIETQSKGVKLSLVRN